MVRTAGLGIIPSNGSSRCALRTTDLLIPAQAIALGYAIVTDNERECARIDDLPSENWLRGA